MELFYIVVVFRWNMLYNSRIAIKSHMPHDHWNFDGIQPEHDRPPRLSMDNTANRFESSTLSAIMKSLQTALVELRMMKIPR